MTRPMVSILGMLSGRLCAVRSVMVASYCLKLLKRQCVALSQLVHGLEKPLGSGKLELMSAAYLTFASANAAFSDYFLSNATTESHNGFGGGL